MGSLTNTYEEKALQCLFGDDHGTPFPDTFWVCLFTATPGEGTFGTEAAGGAYARVEVDNTTANWTVSGDTVENAALVTFPEATGAWGTCTHWGLADHVTDDDPENLVCFGALASPTSPISGDTPEFAIGTLVVGAD